MTVDTILNSLDELGFHKEADVVEAYTKECIAAKRQWDYRKISLLVAPIVMTTLINHINKKPGVTPVKKQDVIQIMPTKKNGPSFLSKKDLNDITKKDPKKFMNFLNAVEGKVSNRKKEFDSGGLTNRGITQKTYDLFRKTKKLKPKSVLQMSENERNAIIKEFYQDPVRADKLPEKISYVVTDWKFHGGDPARALQKILGVEQSGNIGPKTLKAVWNYVGNNPEKDKEIALKLIQERKKYLESLRTKVKGKRVPTIHYNKGWYARLKALKNLVNS